VPVKIGEHTVKVTQLAFAQALARRWHRWFPDNPPDARKEADRALYRTWIGLHEQDVPRSHRSDPADPLISIVVPVHATPPAFLRELLASIAAQTSDRWQLCAVDDGSTTLEPWRILQEFAAQHHDRVVLKRREEAGGIALASNDAIAMASGDYVAFCDHDDVLRRDAVAILSEAIRANPDVDVVYSDHDILEPDGGRAEPRLKPDWSPDLLRSYMYWGHIKCYRAGLLRELHGLRAEFRGAEDYDLALRAAERTQRIVHVPEVLYHWRRHEQSTSSGGTQKAYSIYSGLAALQEHLVRSGIEAEASWPEPSRSAGVGVFRLDFRFSTLPSVAVVIPTRDRLALLSRCVSTLEANTDYPALEIIIVDNDSALPETREYLLGTRHRVLRSPGAFNFSALMNSAARQTDAEYLLFLNNDTEIVATDWLKRMVGFARLPGVGAVGGKLLYPDGRIQHLGVVMGHEALTGHYFQGEKNAADDMGPLCYKRAVRDVAAVTAACMLTPRKLFLETGGFDEVDLRVAWNDVDYCLRLLQKGYRVIVDPDVVLIHHEGVSRGDAKNEREIATMFGRWRGMIEADPFYHPGFARTGRSFALRGEPAEAEFRRLHYARYAREADDAAMTNVGQRAT
jgi:GT2 family glycosyltransferase